MFGEVRADIWLPGGGWGYVPFSADVPFSPSLNAEAVKIYFAKCCFLKIVLSFLNVQIAVLIFQDGTFDLMGPWCLLYF